MSLVNSKIIDSYKSAEKYIFYWSIMNFNCETSINICPKATFNFSVSPNLILTGMLSLEGSQCAYRKLVLRFLAEDGTKSKVDWNLRCKISYGYEEYVNCYLNNCARRAEIPLCVDRDQLTCKLSPGTTHIIRCEIQQEKILKPEPIIKKSLFSENFGQLLKSKEFCDVTMEVAGKDFSAHKNILSCRSPVFRAMFKHQMKEAISNRVVIEDIEPEVFEELLYFIYTDSVLNINSIAFKLLAAADRYDIQRLKAVCEQELIRSITVENAVDSLLAADVHGAADLKVVGKLFIAKNINAVSALDSWQRLLDKGHLLTELLISVLGETSVHINY